MRYSSLSLKDLVCLLCAEPRDNEAWKEFVSRVDTPISLTIIWTIRAVPLSGKRCRSLVEDLKDLRQDTYNKLLQGSRLLREFAIQHPEAVLVYVRRAAGNVTRDHIKHLDALKQGGDKTHVSLDDVDPETPENQVKALLLKEIDELLEHCLTGPHAERDRRIFGFYFREGMSTKQIASLPGIGLTAKGAGSVIDRLTQGIRKQIAGNRSDSDEDRE